MANSFALWAFMPPSPRVELRDLWSRSVNCQRARWRIRLAAVHASIHNHSVQERHPTRRETVKKNRSAVERIVIGGNHYVVPSDCVNPLYNK